MNLFHRVRPSVLPATHSARSTRNNANTVAKGERFWIDHVKQLLADLDISLSHILLTHWHSDHTGGIPDLIAYRPEYADRIYKCDPDRNQQNISHGQVFRVEGATVRAVFTPGHAHDHMCFQLDEENALFTGDNVLGHGQSVYEDLGRFTKSLSDMADLQCQLGYPGHGDVLRDLPRKMRDIVKQREYHEHQIYQTLTCSKVKHLEAGGQGKGSLAIPELIQSLYGSVEPEVYKLAIEPSVVGTLGKLAEDRKVGFQVVDGQKRWFVRERREGRVFRRLGSALPRDAGSS